MEITYIVTNEGETIIGECVKETDNCVVLSNPLRYRCEHNETELKSWIVRDINKLATGEVTFLARDLKRWGTVDDLSLWCMYDEHIKQMKELMK